MDENIGAYCCSSCKIAMEKGHYMRRLFKHFGGKIFCISCMQDLEKFLVEKFFEYKNTLKSNIGCDMEGYAE